MEEVTTTWKALVLNGIATDEELSLVTSINGYSMETINGVVYVRTGYPTFSDWVVSENLEEGD